MNRSVLYLQYANPAIYPPLEHSGLILSKAGWDVSFFGIESEGESNKLQFPDDLARRQTLWKWMPPGLRQKLHYLRFTLAAVWHATRHRAAWVYCSDLMSCPAALLIRRLTSARVVYHEHDSPVTRGHKAEIGKAESKNQETKNISALNISGFHRFLLCTRKRVGRESDLVILPNEKRLDLFTQTTGRQRTSICVYNCPCKEEVTLQHRKPRADNMLRLAFHGSINRDRLPRSVLEAMSCFPGRVHLSVVGYETVGSKGYMASFLQAAERLDLGKSVAFVGALPRRDIFGQASKCDVGLAFMPLLGGDVNMANMTGASNKPFDYLACGLALLVSDLADWKKMYVEPGYGLASNPGDPESIAQALRWFLEHPEETRQMGERGCQRILKAWNYETQFDQALRHMTNGLRKVE